MKASEATQAFVPISEIRDGIAILKDGSYRAVLMASSINFALKSGEEQQAILSQFQNFLNTLDFSLQLYVQSRELNIEPYLALLAGRAEKQTNDLMRVQLREYIGFIRSFTEDVDIMTKSFFVVIPYTPGLLNVGKSLLNLFGKTSGGVDANSFEEHRSQLEQRIAIVESGLLRLGIRTAVLDTTQMIDLFYHIFNPDDEKRVVTS